MSEEISLKDADSSDNDKGVFCVAGPQNLEFVPTKSYIISTEH